MRTTDGYVYFVYSEAQGAIKVGYASDATTRLTKLQTGNPDRLEMYVLVRASYPCERLIHEAFSDDRIVGEWFRATPKLQSFSLALEDEWAERDMWAQLEGQPEPVLREHDVAALISTT